jgi:hypothetical protein
MSVSDAAKARAEAAFKRKEAQARDGAIAWAEYEAKQSAIADNTKRLRALRLAREAATTASPIVSAPARTKPQKRLRHASSPAPTTQDS